MAAWLDRPSDLLRVVRRTVHNASRLAASGPPEGPLWHRFHGRMLADLCLLVGGRSVFNVRGLSAVHEEAHVHGLYNALSRHPPAVWSVGR